MSSVAPPPYPPALLYFPAQILQRLPPQLQSYDVEIIITLQAILSLPPCLSVNGPVYTLPLALFCLAILSQKSSSPAATTTSSYLSHFLFLWIISIVLDLWWLLYRSGSTGSFVTFCVGMSMIMKVISAGLVGQLIGGDGNGAYEGFQGGGYGGGTAAGWMSRAANSVGAQGGVWSTGALSRGADDLEEQLPGGYSSIYDEDEENAKARGQGSSSRAGAYGSYADDGQDATEADAQHVNVTGPAGISAHKSYT